MKSTVRGVVLPLSALALGMAGSLLAAGPADAAAYTTSSICGSGYATVGSYKVTYKTVAGSDKQFGTVYLGYNSGNGNNCAYTLKYSGAAQNNFWGYPTTVGVKLLTEGSTWATQSGKFKYYAGPVYRYGRGKCVKLVADVTNNSGINAHFANSGWVHCG